MVGETKMDPLSVIDQFATMNDPTSINNALTNALSAVDNMDNLPSHWNHVSIASLAGGGLVNKIGDGESSEEILLLQDQILRSATRILFAEQEAKVTRDEAQNNSDKLQKLETEIESIATLHSKIKCDRTDEEKQALEEFRVAMEKARRDYEERKQSASAKRRVKLHLLAAAKDRLETMRVSYDELSRTYARKAVEQEQKLNKEKLLYKLQLESLAAAQEQQEDHNPSKPDDDSSTEGTMTDDDSTVL
jgi:hypothetical protein